MKTMQSVCILGSTGSIGANTLDVVSRHPERFQVVALTALSISVQIYAFGVLVNVARKDSGAVRIAASVVVVLPAMIALMTSLPNLPRPAPSAAERERLVQLQYAEIYGNTDANIDHQTRERLVASVRRNVGRQLDRPGRSSVPWIAAATLTTIGIVALLDSRKRWLNLELG